MASPADRLVTPVRKSELSAADTPQIFGGEAPERRSKKRKRGVVGARQEALEDENEGLRADDDSGEMSIEDIQAVLTAEIDAATNFVDGEVADDRAKALRYYRGDITDDMPDEDGRSKAVHRVLHDTIMQILPSLVRIFMGAEHIVRFAPNKPGKEEEADQRTDFIHHVVFEENNGFEVLYSAMKDALMLRSGYLTWGIDERREVVREKYTGLTQQAMMELGSDEDVTDLAFSQDGQVDIPIDELQELGLTDADGPPAMGAQAPTDPQGMAVTAPAPSSNTTISVPTYTVSLKRERTRKDIVVFAIPGEEFLRSPNARTIDDSPLCGWRRLLTRSDLIAMGVPEEFLEEHGGSEGEIGFYTNAEISEREPDKGTRETTFNTDLARTLYTKNYIRIDRDGDGIAELLMIPTIGWGHTIWEDGIEDATEIPFAQLCPNPEAHQFEGEGVCDDTMDAQLIMSMVLRSTLDSLALSIHPRTVANPNKVNIFDVLNTEIGAVIRADDVTQVRQEVTPFVGRDGLVMLEHFQGIVQQRTGVLAPPDPENLQSTTKRAVDMQERQATQRIELIARIFAECGLKRFFWGIQRLAMQHMDVAKTIRLRGKWVTVDPSTWDAAMDVRLSVGLNMGTPEERMGFLKETLAEMKTIITTLGPDNPICGLPQYRAVLARITELAGYPDTEQFWKPLAQDWQPPQAPPQESDQLQAAKILAETTRYTEDLKAKLAREQMEIDKMKIAADFNVKIAVAEIKEGIDRDNAALQAEVTQMIERMRLDLQRSIAELRTNTELAKTGLQLGAKAGEAAAQPPAGGA